MKKISSGWLVVIAILIFALNAGLSFCLLLNEYIEPQNFVTLVLGGAIFVFMFLFIDRISEVSLGGTIFRLKELNNKSEKLLEALQIEYFKMRLELAFTATGFWDDGSNVFESRIKFYSVICDIRSEGLLNHPELNQKIRTQLNKTLQHQLEHIRTFGNIDSDNPFIGVYEPLALRSLISQEIIHKRVSIKDPLRNTPELAKQQIFDSIEIYENLYQAKRWLEEQ